MPFQVPALGGRRRQLVKDRRAQTTRASTYFVGAARRAHLRRNIFGSTPIRRALARKTFLAATVLLRRRAAHRVIINASRSAAVEKAKLLFHSCYNECHAPATLRVVYSSLGRHSWLLNRRERR